MQPRATTGIFFVVFQEADMQDHEDTKNSNAEFYIFHITIDSNNKRSENDLATMCSASRFTTQSEMEGKKTKKRMTVIHKDSKKW